MKLYRERLNLVGILLVEIKHRNGLQNCMVIAEYVSLPYALKHWKVRRRKFFVCVCVWGGDEVYPQVSGLATCS